VRRLDFDTDCVISVLRITRTNRGQGRMDYDPSIDSVLLPLPFHVLVTVHGSPILVKLHVAEDLTLDVLATDLERAYHERLRPRQLTSRVLASGGADADRSKLLQALVDFVAEQGHKGASSSETHVEPSDHGVRPGPSQYIVTKRTPLSL
jgi:hypothetical protein